MNSIGIQTDPDIVTLDITNKLKNIENNQKKIIETVEVQNRLINSKHKKLNIHISNCYSKLAADMMEYTLSLQIKLNKMNQTD